MIDGHMHLEYGDLSIEYVLQFVQQAVKMGLTEIDILDHTHRFREFKPIYEHLRKYPVQDQWLNGRTKFCNSLDEYAELIAKVRQLDLPITVKFGLEVCYSEDTEELIREILKGRKYDFLTGAVHSVNSILYDMKFSRELLWNRYSADDIYDWYYRQAISCVRSGLFDRLAHPDTIKLFNIYPEKDLRETYYQLSEELVRHQVLAECNTGCHYRYGHQDIGLSAELLAIFRERKVEMITASDAHHPEDVGKYIKEAEERIHGGNDHAESNL